METRSYNSCTLELNIPHCKAQCIINIHVERSLLQYASVNHLPDEQEERRERREERGKRAILWIHEGNQCTSELSGFK
jgi:hypothetical protein